MIKFSLPDNSVINIPPLSKKEVQFIYKEIFVNQCYLQHGIAVSDGDFILDIGANVGLFTIYLARTFKNLRIFSFEPTPPVYNCLQKNVSCYKNVKTYNVGFAETEKEAVIDYLPHAPGSSTLFFNENKDLADKFSGEFDIVDIYKLDKKIFFLLLLCYPFRRKITKHFIDKMYSDVEKHKCKLISLDSFIKENGIEYIDLLKIDVESAEKDIFEGISDSNLQKIKQIVMEVSPKNKTWINEIKTRLTKCGFSRINVESMCSGAVHKKDSYSCDLYAVR